MYHQRASIIILSTTVLLIAAGCASRPSGVSAENSTVDTRLSCVLPTNCVNSRTTSGLSPLQFTGTGAQGLALLETTLASFPEATVVEKDENMLRAVFTTPAGFRDDVIFLIDQQQRRINFQSQSGIGLYDFGKNRSRMQLVAQRFAEAAAKSR